MKFIQPLLWGLTVAGMLTAASSLSLFMVVADSHAAGASADHAEHLHTAPAGAGPWLADSSLINGMQRIETAVGEAHARGAAFDASALGSLVQGEVALLIENCRLEPAADAALHALLLPLLANAAKLGEGRETQAALAGLYDVLQEYRRSFVASAQEPGHAH